MLSCDKAISRLQLNHGGLTESWGGGGGSRGGSKGISREGSMPRWIEATEDSCRFHRTLMILPELKIRVSPRKPHQHEWKSVLFTCILKSIGKTRPRFPILD
jgi:hypothetical protein